MKTSLRAGVIALAALGLLSNVSAGYANDFATASEQSQLAASINIGRVHSTLKLTPEQEAYWPAVESALLKVAGQQAQAEPGGIMRRISRRVVSIVLNSAAVERLALAARPLIAVLNDEQKRAASGLAQEMGLGPVVLAALR